MIISAKKTSVIKIGATTASDFDIVASNGSDELVLGACCIDCNTPSIIGDLYDGQLFVPFECDVQDGTRIIELITGGVGIVYDGGGLIELNKRLKTGDSVKLQVDDETCKAISANVIVKGRESECAECDNDEPCFIRVTEIETPIANGKATITTLNTEDSGTLVYRLDGGDWVENVSDLPQLTLGVLHTIGLKDRNNILCREEYPMVALNKVITVTEYV